MKDNLVFRFFVFICVLCSLFSVSRFFSWSKLDFFSRVNIFLSLLLLLFGLFVLFRFSRERVVVNVSTVKVDSELRELRQEVHRSPPVVVDKPKVVEPNVVPSSVPPIVKRQVDDLSMYQERNTFKPVKQSKGEYEDLF